MSQETPAGRDRDLPDDGFPTGEDAAPSPLTPMSPRRRKRAIKAVALVGWCSDHKASRAVDQDDPAAATDEKLFHPAIRAVLDAYRTGTATAAAVAALASDDAQASCSGTEVHVRLRWLSGVKVVASEGRWDRARGRDPFGHSRMYDTGLPADCANPWRVARALVKLAEEELGDVDLAFAEDGRDLLRGDSPFVNLDE